MWPLHRRARVDDVDDTSAEAARRVADAVTELEVSFRLIAPALDPLPGIVTPPPRKDPHGDRHP